MWSPYLSCWKLSPVKCVEIRSALRPRHRAEYQPRRTATTSCRKTLFRDQTSLYRDGFSTKRFVFFSIFQLRRYFWVCVHQWESEEQTVRGLSSDSDMSLRFLSEWVSTQKWFIMNTRITAFQSLCRRLCLIVRQVAGHAGSTWTAPQGKGTTRQSSACRCCIPLRSAPNRWPSKPRQRPASRHTGPVTYFKCEWRRYQRKETKHIDVGCTDDEGDWIRFLSILYLQWTMLIILFLALWCWIFYENILFVFIFFSFIKSRFFVVQWITLLFNKVAVRAHYRSFKFSHWAALFNDDIMLCNSFLGGRYFADMMLVVVLPVWTPSSPVEGSAKTTRSASHARWLSVQCELSVQNSSTAFKGFTGGVQGAFNLRDNGWSQKKCILILCCAV